MNKELRIEVIVTFDDMAYLAHVRRYFKGIKRSDEEIKTRAIQHAAGALKKLLEKDDQFLYGVFQRGKAYLEGTEFKRHYALGEKTTNEYYDLLNPELDIDYELERQAHEKREFLNDIEDGTICWLCHHKDQFHPYFGTCFICGSKLPYKHTQKDPN